ncbi:hypothetical protein P692DRAFT_2062625 [Suillus brevipes Sb2]|nr:hypothetical protein P692DRAFT_2062625 [Suillus brevipes Sb2]
MFALERGLCKCWFDLFKARIPRSAAATCARFPISIRPALELGEPRFLHFSICLPACSQDSIARLVTNIHSSSSSSSKIRQVFLARGAQSTALSRYYQVIADSDFKAACKFCLNSSHLTLLPDPSELVSSAHYYIKRKRQGFSQRHFPRAQGTRHRTP